MPAVEVLRLTGKVSLQWSQGEEKRERRWNDDQHEFDWRFKHRNGMAQRILYTSSSDDRRMLLGTHREFLDARAVSITQPSAGIH